MRSRFDERRKHVVFITRHTEYHCRGRECVAVRDVDSGRWRARHFALRGRLLGGRAARHSPFSPTVKPGMRLVIANEGRGIMTSALLSVRRPSKGVLWHYTNLCKAGVIEARATA